MTPKKNGGAADRDTAEGAAVASAAGDTKRSIRPPRLFVYVDAVARHRSIRKAAEALRIASSALNRRILDLEEELGTTLFERLPRGVRLTAAGELFVGYVRHALADLESVGSQIEHLRGLVRGRVRLAAAESVAGDLLPNAIAQFQQSHPGVRFYVTVGGPKELIAALVDDTVDLILTHATPENRDVTVLATARQALCVVVTADHPLAALPAPYLRDCQGYPIALADETLAGRSLIDQALAKASFRFDPALVSNSVEAMKAFARSNKALCFQFGAPGRRNAVPGGMVAIPLADPALMRAQLLLAMRRDRVLPIAAASFAEQLKTSLESV